MKKEKKGNLIKKSDTETRWVLDKPFVTTEGWFSGWDIVYSEKPHCGECGKEIKLGEKVQWTIVRRGNKENKFLSCMKCIKMNKEVG